MAARDRWTMTITCPNCGHSGSAECSESDYPFMSSPDFRYDALPAGFSRGKRLRDTRQQTFVVCKCGEEFHS